eukprot:6302012-Amphidinium_carterae.1
MNCASTEYQDLSNVNPAPLPQMAAIDLLQRRLQNSEIANTKSVLEHHELLYRRIKALLVGPALSEMYAWGQATGAEREDLERLILTAAGNPEGEVEETMTRRTKEMSKRDKIIAT